VTRHDGVYQMLAVFVRQRQVNLVGTAWILKSLPTEIGFRNVRIRFADAYRSGKDFLLSKCHDVSPVVNCWEYSL